MNLFFPKNLLEPVISFKEITVLSLMKISVSFFYVPADVFLPRRAECSDPVPAGISVSLCLSVSVSVSPHLPSLSPH